MTSSHYRTSLLHLWNAFPLRFGVQLAKSGLGQDWSVWAGALQCPCSPSVTAAEAQRCQWRPWLLPRLRFLPLPRPDAKRDGSPFSPFAVVPVPVLVACLLDLDLLLLIPSHLPSLFGIVEALSGHDYCLSPPLKFAFPRQLPTLVLTTIPPTCTTPARNEILSHPLASSASFACRICTALCRCHRPLVRPFSTLSPVSC
ncbi:hypothetical protein V8F20_000638 [Naviculisporaceae sp. PSN 640]